jgi:hypothetical protein
LNFLLPSFASAMLPECRTRLQRGPRSGLRLYRMMSCRRHQGPPQPARGPPISADAPSTASLLKAVVGTRFAETLERQRDACIVTLPSAPRRAKRKEKLTSSLRLVRETRLAAEVSLKVWFALGRQAAAPSELKGVATSEAATASSASELWLLAVRVWFALGR